MRIMTCCYFLVVDSRLPLAIIIFCRSRLPPPPQVGTADEAAFIDAIVSSTDSVTSADQVIITGCTDTDRRRRQLMATTDTVDIASEITIEDPDGTAAATLTAEVIAAASDGTFGSAVVANSGSTSVLATATVESVGAVEVEEDNEDDEDDDDDDDGLTGAGIVLIILAAIALIIGAYLIFLKEGFCFNTGPKAEAGGQEMVAAKANGVNVAI